MLDVGDDLVGRKTGANIRTEQLEFGAFREPDFKLDAAVNRRGVERENARLCALPKRQLDAAKLHVVGNGQPNLFELFPCTDGQRHRLGELLPDRLQRLEVGVAPFLLLVCGERRGHAAASA